MPRILITGANRGIGLGLAKAYLKKGYEVIATCRDPARAHELKSLDGPLEIRRLDVTDHDAVEALAGDLKDKPVDILINNAGVLGSPNFDRGGAGQTLGDVDYDGLRHTLEVNSIAPLKVTEAFLKNLEAGREKKVITITSRMGAISEMEGGFVAYRSSKAAVNAIMKNISHALKEKGIATAVLHPGWVRTDMGSGEAPLSVEDSVKGLFQQIDKLALENSGRFLSFEGEEIPW